MFTRDEGPVGAFTVDCAIQHPVHRERVLTVPRVLVDSGSELTWIPPPILEALGIVPEKERMAFVMANGRELIRDVGFAIVRAGDRFTTDEVVFGDPGVLPLLRARSLERMNLAVDPRRRQLVSVGAMPAAHVVATLCPMTLSVAVPP